MSWTCERALRRFLGRCPAIQSHPKFAALPQKGAALQSDDLVDALGDLFLHPCYTIPVMGCFRPLCRNILQRAVEKLRIVPSLVLESSDDCDEIGEEDINIIDFYIARRRSLKLHELACLAFCRALDMSPFLLKYVLSYFRFSPSPFWRLFSVGTALSCTAKIAYLIVDVVRVTYRLLVMEPKVFSELWDWSIFLDLIDVIAVHPLLDCVLDIRWCALQILSVVLRSSDRTIPNSGMKQDDSFMCLLRWEEFCQDTSFEKAGWYLKEDQLANASCSIEAEHQSQLIESFNDCSLSYSLDGGSKWSLKNKVSCKQSLLEGYFVLTTTLKESFEMVRMALHQKWPVLLYGPASSGKTALINDVALKSGNKVLFIHMDEQMDSKSLIGSYICSEQPGEFKWQPGSLTHAILSGLWVVFEDIDKAPNEVQSIILPLLEGSSSLVTGNGEVISVSESFRLFGTVSTSRHEIYHPNEGRFSVSVFWRKVVVRAANMDDMKEIIAARYPVLDFLSSQLVETFECVNSLVSYQMGGMVASSFSRFSLRDLLKWCKRIAGLFLNFAGPGLSISVRQHIYQEAIDVFVACLTVPEIRLLVMREIANLWGVPPPEETSLCLCRNPDLQMQGSVLQVGRVILHCVDKNCIPKRQSFIGIKSALHSLERIACSVRYNEPILLVGETGTGKTTLVQNLAMRLGQSLIVMNLSQQSDATDLLGGFKPADARSICIPLYHEFKELFCKTFSEMDNEDFLRCCEVYVIQKKWKKLLRACQKPVENVKKLVLKITESGRGSKRKRPLSEEMLHLWDSFSLRLDCAYKKINISAGMSFKFVEGAFITALKSGKWLLLDEVNLAPPETLQRIIGVLDGENGTICLAERGDVDYVPRHPNFRLFACMNPATDAGKKELPFAFRSRFTEYCIDDVLDDGDLFLFVSQYIGELEVKPEVLKKIVQFYKAAKKESEERLQDSANQKPQFSLRSLARALEYTKKAEKEFGFQSALYDGFCMFFVAFLDGPSANIMHNIVLQHLLAGRIPPDIPLEKYFLKSLKPHDANYVITKSVRAHLKNLARAVFIKRYPVLLQGPTSSGKTSLVQYLALITEHQFVRINNHEHTDLQEYFGSYIPDAHGQLQFQEGVLVKAVRRGYWIVLDELNLAPSDVLESLNRLLDDNRELFLPELQETIPAHPDFMLFATQNPPTIYGGRKVLSRAFRNRFLEMHVDEIPEDELATILEKRCSIPASYASRMVEVMKYLQLHRQNSKVFAGKHGFITPRDLFRWANRFRAFGMCEDLAKDGYFLLAERLRDENEKNVVRDVLEHHLRVELNIDGLYKLGSDQSDTLLVYAEPTCSIEKLGSITWTRSMQRLYFLLQRCYKLREPVLLVGDTGGGKTTVCQLLSAVLGSRLHILNCHQYTETSDFIGGFHPVRERPRLALEFKQYVQRIKESNCFLHFSGDYDLSPDICQASLTLYHLDQIEAKYRKDSALHPNVAQGDFEIFEKIKFELMQLHQMWQTVFTWQDGPLVKAMKEGDLFLVDEISLADDSVLERLNSVLEQERKLLLAEKGGPVPEMVTAHPNFFILATMNPGGDYGKKELSPALRNRFTEIWVPPVSDIEELKCIALENLSNPELTSFLNCMLSFWKWFNMLQTGRVLTVRDFLSWISFINATEIRLGPEYALLHGAFLVLLDGLSMGTGISSNEAQILRKQSLEFLIEELKASGCGLISSHLSELESYGWGNYVKQADSSFVPGVHSQNLFGIDPFYIFKGDDDCKCGGFEFMAPTTCRNVLRVLRAMQLPRPVLLEGSPGVGKTSLIVALAQHSGHTVVRINLSEQTDMMDLLGSDLPVEGASGMEFSWADGILLQALKKGSWVLLDELNLAPQSVLEGLNAILDHRAEVYIPELGQTFKCPASFRVFACQNPSSQGGGRKGLPKSFLNRFTKVHVDELAADDFLFICQSIYPSIHSTLLSKLITFNSRLYEQTMVHHIYGQAGSPWEFNLRDVLRSCEIIKGTPTNARFESFLNVVYIQRMRTAEDRVEVMKLYEDVFGMKPSISQFPEVHIDPQYFVVGSALIERNHFQPTKAFKNQLNLLPGVLQSLEAVAHCVQRQWLCILVGPSSSGKTSMIRMLAQLTGNVLNELSLSPATDVTELLGCFEQYNSFRCFKAALSQIEHFVDEYFSLRLELNWKDLIAERKNLFSSWFSFISSHSYVRSTSSFSTSWMGDSPSSLDPLLDIISQLKHDVERFSLPVSWSLKDLDKTLKSIQLLQKNWLTEASAKFEWVPGNLVKAIECGEWVILDNANLCNPTVLDRINSLVEPDGSITVNECGLVDGKPLILKSHSKFRMFIAIDPKFGEVSRAMRNRGVEIFLLEPHFSPDQMTITCEDVDELNTRRFLIQSGIPLENLISAMSKAHLSAKAVGFHHGVQISLLELSRWVQLFQQLIMNGNQPTWSLQLSWEHTYLAALGEPYAREFVMQGKSLYLGEAELYKRDSQTCCSLSLPGGWPLPHTLKNFIHYSRESCVKQNCLYLEFLGGQCASYNLSKNISWFSGSKYKRYFPIILPLDMLHQALFLCTPCDQSNKCAKFDYERTNQMLFFAANWTLEQATESDVSLYILCFKWYNTKLQPHCHFFGSFSKIVEKQISHPIWSYITRLQKELLVHHGINIYGQPITILSSKLVEFSVANPSLLHRQTLLMDAIQSGSLLRRTYKQWNAEDDVVPSRETFQPTLQTVLNSLRQLECEVLKLIVEHDELFDEYSCLLEIHSLFWEKSRSSNFEHVSIIWSWLKKQVMKFQPRFPAAVDAFLVESRNLKCIPGWKLDLVKPTLWIRGGHPYIPSSSVVFYKQRQIRSLCAKIWQSCKMSKETCSGQVSLLDVIVSANSDLRRLAMEGDSMSRVMLAKGAQSCALIVHQLDDIHQSLLSRFEHERMCLEPTFKSTQYLKSSPGFSHATCCVFSMEDLCQKACFESWSKVLLLLNRRSLSLDIVILLSLSKGTLHDDYEAYKVPAKVKDIIQQNLDYSLDYSSRSPLDFSAHQILLWCFDACNSLDSVHPSFASLVLEMWFRWHKSLWNCFSERVKVIYPWAEDEVSYFAMFPARSKILGTILQGALSIKDYNVDRLMLRVTSRALWQDASAHGNLIEAFRAAADCLFKQILLVHEKHFDKDAFGKLKCMLVGFKNRHATPHEVQTLRSLIMSSGHGPLTSLMELVIEPLLKDLYVECKPNDSLYNLGHAWVHLGALRFNLLSNPDQTDPALKNAFKHSWILQRITLLELEMKVRRECQTLSGKGTAKVDEKMREKKEKLEMEKNQVQEKDVFRPEPSKYKKLKSACAIFSEFVSSSPMSLLNNLKCHADLSFMIKMAQNWQITSESFNNRLSEEFADYIDLVQPVQLAVYEMKFGLSLVISGILEREYVNKIQISNIDTLLASIYSIMQFPKILPITCNLEIYQNSVRKNILNAQVLDNLIANSLKINPVQDISPMQLQLVIYHIAFIHVVHNICSSLVMDKSSFLLLNEILVHFSSLWMGMKSQEKTMDAVEAQYYKFKPRSIIVDEFMERDISSLSMLDSDGNLSTESQELLMEQEFAKVKGPFKKAENIEDWTMTSESISNSVVHIHNQLFGSRFKQLFGSRNLVERPGITCDERLRLFKDSYRVGSILLEGLEASSIIDDNLLPEYLLRVSLEHYERSSSSRGVNTCNVYGDAETMFKMVEPLSAVQRKVQSFLDEWPDHPGLIKIMDIIETLLDIPACSPLSKVISL
ncbi:hypothetical protein AXF42_Ash013973 [Apostasia shenzhenica]|uniref:Midasin n=1 Tax=Apostasia shenzhenica TaxID=1088818 RepID=A0A2I0ASF2_9ASPA|nr:hypothetical protein AXF42_Ash013973 [Apostasia shenzhenica]